MDDIILNNGVKMPKVGFGVYLMNNPEACERSVTDAINAGYRFN